MGLIFMCVQFGADQENNLDLVNLNVVSLRDCLALTDYVVFPLTYVCSFVN